MQMTLKQAHIEAAIRDFVAKAGITFPVEEMNFTAGRGKDGLTATIDMADPFSALLDGAVKEEEAPAPKAKPLSKRADTTTKVEPTPEPEPEPVATNEPEFSDPEDEVPFSDPQPVKEEIIEPPKAAGSLFSS